MKKMSETITKQKKKKKKEYDYEAVAEHLNSMIEDLERTEKDTVLEIWKEYQKAPDLEKFFSQLNKSDTWCRLKFHEYNLKLRQPQKDQGEALKEAYAERKVEQLIQVFEQDEEPDQEFIEQIKTEPAIKITASDDFTAYETTMGLISKCYKITRSDFDVGNHKYKMKLVDELKRAISHLEDILKEVENEYERT